MRTATASPSPEQAQDIAALCPPQGRLAAMDWQRGLLMATMALDHASLFIARTHAREFWGAPLPVFPDAFWFWMRWVTHFCATGFALLMGMGMALMVAARLRAGESAGAIRRQFIQRGLLLIALQFLLEDPAWIVGIFSAAPGAAVMRGEMPGGGTSVMLHFGVLFSLGAGMLIWGLLPKLPSGAVAALSLLAAALTEWAIALQPSTQVLVTPWLRVLLVPGHTNLWQVAYPVVPWLTVIGLGILLGRGLLTDFAALRRHAAWGAGLLLLVFVLLRIAGGVGNLNVVPPGWQGFLTVVKYPPSLAFMALTLAPNLALIALWPRLEPHAERARSGPFMAFGRCALMFYIVHLWFYALVGLLFPQGTRAPIMLGIWLAGLLLLWPLCLRYDRFRRTRGPNSLWHLF